MIIIGLINDSECRTDPTEIVRSFHSSISLWQHNRPKRFKMKLDEDSKIAINSSHYPLARKDNSIVDDFHGTKVADPYRWLEDPDLNETKEFIEQLNSVSRPFIASSPYREKLRKSVLYRQKTLFDESEVFLDPNKLSDDGTTAIRYECFSHDGSLFAYGLSQKGSDWMTLKFKKADGTDLNDTVVGVKHGNLDWLIDNSGVFYSKYPEHKSALEGSSTEKHEYHSLYFHKLGTPQNDDVLVADFRSHPEYMCSGSVTEDGRYLIVDVSRGCDPYNMLYYYDVQEAQQKITGKVSLKPLFDKLDAKYEFVDNDGDTALILTNYDAPLFKLIRVKMSTANEGPSEWETVIPEDKKNTLEWVANVGGDRLVVSYIEDVKNKIYVYCPKTGQRLYEIPLETGTVSSFFGRKDHTEMFLRFDSFLTPGVIYYVDFKDTEPSHQVKLKEIRRIKAKGIDTSKFVVKQVFCESKDGTKASLLILKKLCSRKVGLMMMTLLGAPEINLFESLQVPLYIVHNKDLELNGNTPTLLYGYGGFNVAEMPYFSVSRMLFLDNFKGVFVLANLRGGSEYGEKWHEGGMRERKQNVFDDFIAAAEYLINNNYTSSRRLAIRGGSNGGLLVAAVSQQRPELFGAVVNQVGVLDMLRYHKFTIGSAWIPEYGNPTEASDFEFIYKYSPLHNIEIPNKGYQWPSTMLTTADHDDRVVPSHSLKYMARLYEAAQSSNSFQKKPLIIRVDVKAGHGSGKPTSKLIDETVDVYCFLQRVLDLKWHESE
ncbi:unnamed protein product [Litomosoides sigmodontis]|uniref:Prolyl endopeptidase n=1 Tax=Litomosoides sigmodontis TaxID=42156 RepID=A0A3P6T6X6_LITSI|nr:unnamed protein product [Litomosoides sigmodontis]